MKVQVSHHSIASHRLVVLAEVNTVSQDWGNLFFKFSLAEALEEISSSIAKEAWLQNENAINFCFDYIHCSCFNFCSLIRSSKIIPSFFTIKKGFFLPLRLSCKESSTFLTKPLFPQEREDVTALRCSEPLRYKVGGPSKVSPGCTGWTSLLWASSL